jgi:spermidine/putrescine transport system permease protein
MSGARAGRLWRLWLWTVLALVYLPILALVVMSFNAARYGTFPFEFTWRWYESLAGNARLWEATLRSLWLSLAVAAAAAAIGTMAAVWTTRFGRAGARALQVLMVAAITVPWLILAIAILLAALWVGAGRGLPALFLGSLVVAMPYAALVVQTRLQGLGPDAELAARSLGAGPLRAFLLVTLPAIGRAVLSGAMLAFVITFNNFPLHFFLAPFGFNTLPMEVYSYVLTGYVPDINALATLLIGGAVLAGLAALGLGRLRRG